MEEDRATAHDVAAKETFSVSSIIDRKIACTDILDRQAIRAAYQRQAGQEFRPTCAMEIFLKKGDSTMNVQETTVEQNTTEETLDLELDLEELESRIAPYYPTQTLCDS